MYSAAEVSELRTKSFEDGCIITEQWALRLVEEMERGERSIDGVKALLSGRQPTETAEIVSNNEMPENHLSTV